MRTRDSFVDEKEQLINNIKMTFERVKYITDIDNKLYKIYKKPLDFGCGGHLSLLIIYYMIILFGTLYLTFDKVDLYDDSVVGYFLAGIVISYCLIIFFINRYVMISKKFMFQNEIKELPKKRKESIIYLTNKSIIPKDYWNVLYLNNLIKYFENKRADNLKEALNLLEQDIKHDQKMAQLFVIEEEMTRPRFYITYTID